MTASPSRRAALAPLAAAMLAGCATPGVGPPDPDISQPPGATALATPSASEQALTEVFPYDRFSDPTTIDNPWLPLIPGTQWVWDGETVEDGEAVPHRVILTVTDMTKVVDGIETVVALDQDFSDDALVEMEIVFLAQDDDGAVWHLGQYPEEYENGELVGWPGWIAGQQEALAGYWMTADPAVGTRSYSQGWGPVVGWTDRGLVVEEGIEDCVPIGCYEDVIVIEEWALDDPDAKQLKYYARGVGTIRVGWSGSEDQEQESLELSAYGPIDDAALAQIRELALELEARAYENLPEIFDSTEPMRGGS